MKFLILGMFFISQASFATPAKVIILRHAEKDPSGDTLNARGYARADALVKLFADNPALNEAGTPVAIFAADPKHDTSSVRPIETITPLAKSLGLTIREEFNKDHVQGIHDEVMNDQAFDGKVVVICWVRQSILPLLKSFGATDLPASWPEELFDRMMILDFNASGLIQYRNLSQNTMPGDTVN